MTGGKMKIMIVEDETWSALMIANYVSTLGHHCVDPIAAGNEAVRRAAEEDPDVIFMDIRLADDVNGIEAARRIADENPRVKIAYMSAYQDADVVEEARKINCIAYFNKPLDMGEIKEMLEMCSESLLNKA